MGNAVPAVAPAAARYRGARRGLEGGGGFADISKIWRVPAKKQPRFGGLELPNEFTDKGEWKLLLP